MFSVYLATTEKQSMMHFGGFDQTIIDKLGTKGEDSDNKSEDGIFWMNSASTNHWQVNIYDFKIGDKPFELSIDQAILDTGSSLNYIPSSNFKMVMEEIMRDQECR